MTERSDICLPSDEPGPTPLVTNAGEEPERVAADQLGFPEARAGGGEPVTRYVAIGDSTVEGLEAPGSDGVYVGWADRLARHLRTVALDANRTGRAGRS